MQSSDSNKRYILGIDIGTTTVKVALLDYTTEHVLQTKFRETHAQVFSSLGSIGNEQDVSKIVTALQFCVSSLAKDSLTCVKHIAMSCQMHGIMFWGDGQRTGFNRNACSGRIECDASCSHLYTWQDGRCNAAFLNDMPHSTETATPSTGYGIATLCWLLQHQPSVVQTATSCGTIGDYIIAALCEDAGVANISTQNANSWGYYSMRNGDWQTDLLAEAGVPLSLLPRVRAASSTSGHMTRSWYAIGSGVDVAVCAGDLQSSVYSRLHGHGDDYTAAVLNISTSAQLAFPMPSNFTPPPHDLRNKDDATPNIDYLPYFSHESNATGQHTDRYLAVAASLTGGNVLSSFVNMLQQWTHELGIGVPQDKIWQVIQRLANQQKHSDEGDMVIVPTIFGERHCPYQKASVGNICHRNYELGSVYRSLCHGVINNLYSMMSSETLKEAGITRILASGTAISKNVIIKEKIEQLYCLPVEMCREDIAQSDSAIGAALSRIHYIKIES